MKKLMLLSIAFFTFNMLNAMDEKATHNPQKDIDSFIQLFAHLHAKPCDTIMSYVLADHIRKIPQDTNHKSNGQITKIFFFYLFSTRIMKTDEGPKSVRILALPTIKKYVEEFAYQAFKLRQGNLIIPHSCLEKIRSAYTQENSHIDVIEEILDYKKSSLWALSFDNQIFNYRYFRGMNIKSLEGLALFIAMRNKERELRLKKLLGLSCFSSAFEDYLRLRDLDFSDNQITVLPNSVGQLTELKELNLSKNQLTALPESLGQLTDLEDLNLSNNQLTALPESLGQLTSLDILNLAFNNVTAVPESLGSLTALKLLSLSDNQLTFLPDLSKLTRLILLNCTHNKLTTFPESLCRLINLSNLFFNNNLLDSLPPTITQLTKLKNLFLSNNNLTDNLDIQLFASLSNLATLDLAKNKFSEEKKKAIKEKFGTKIANLTL